MDNYPYPGESDEKKIARALVYLRAKTLWEVTGVRAGKIVTLAGDGIEFSLFANFLDMSPHDMVFVDKKPESIKAVRERSSIVNTYQGDILKFLQKNQNPIRLINLDFMGYFEMEKTDKVLLEADRALVKGGILAFTFMRVRDGEHSTHWPTLEKKAMEYVAARGASLGKTRHEVQTSIRFFGYEQLFSDILGDDYRLVLNLKYSKVDSGAHMGIVVFQKLPSYMRGTKWIDALREAPFREIEEGAVERKGASIRLREMILHLIDSGMDSASIAGLFGLKVGNIAAYRSHVTRKKGRE